MRYRHASTLGDRYAFPVYFATREEAQAHHNLGQQFLGDLPGMDSMRVEELINGEWQPLRSSR